MQTIIVTIKDESKAGELVGKLSEMEYVRFRVIRARKKTAGAPDIKKLFGLWKGRTISARSLRTSSWKRSYR